MFNTTRPRQITTLLALATLSLLLSACALIGGASADTEVGLQAQPTAGLLRDEAPAEEEAEEAPGLAGPPVAEGAAASDTDALPAEEPLAVPAGDVAIGVEVAPLTEAERSDGEAFAASGGDGADALRAEAPVAQQVLELRAGEIDDNADWDDYLLYRREFLQAGGYPVHDVEVSGRHVIHVETEGGSPVLGARVRVYSGQALVSETRTYATGQTLFLPNATSRARGSDSFDVRVDKGGLSAEFTLNVNETNEWFVILDGAQPAQGRANLDVLFLIDATGSMQDEIEQLQSNILSISRQIDALPSRPNTRYGMVTYRDRYDAYVTRVFDFTPDVREFQAALSDVRAEGGDDYPESLNEALYDAVHRPEWRVDDTVSLVFLVADAPPHLDYANDDDYAVEMLEAARLGIKVHPIASSGLDPQGEYIFRQIAQATMGHFVFLAYEQEQGDFARPDLEAGQGDYSVNALDDLVLRLITDELAALNRQ